MAKEFKEWDKKFTRGQLSVEAAKWLSKGTRSEIESITRWPYTLSSGGWHMEYIRFCTYLASDAAKWQLFRVSLKGMTTQEKLFCLGKYGDVYFVNNLVWQLRKIEKCRIDNYINALKRGGQLNENMEIVK